MRCRLLGAPASVGGLTVATFALPQPREDLRLTTSSWLSHSVSQESVCVAARVTNKGSEDLRISGGVQFRVDYAPSAWSESVLAVRTDSVMNESSEILASGRHYRCGGLPGIPRLDRSARHSRQSRGVLVVRPGEALADTFSFAVPRTAFREWPGALVVKCSLWVETGQSGKPWDVYAPEDVWVSVPVP